MLENLWRAQYMHRLLEHICLYVTNGCQGRGHHVVVELKGNMCHRTSTTITTGQEAQATRNGAANGAPELFRAG